MRTTEGRTAFATARALVAVAALATLARAQSADGAWVNLGAPGFTAGAALSGDIAADGFGRVHVSYKAMETPDGATLVRRWDEARGAWRTLGGRASRGTSWYNELAFGPGETPLVVHRDYAVGGRLNVRALRSDAWIDVGPPGGLLGDAHYTRIAIGRAGVPVVAYQDHSTTPPDQVTVAAYSFADRRWSALAGHGVSGGTAGYVSLAVGPQGAPWIAFADGLAGGRLTVMRFDAQGGWSLVGPRGGGSSAQAHNATLCFDGQGRAHTAHHVWHSRIEVRRFDGTSWVPLGINPASGPDAPTVESEHWRQWLSLAFDGDDAPFVAYQRLSDRRAVVRRLDPATQRWEAVGPVGFTPGRADYLSMTVDGEGRPVVAFRDGAHADRLSVMRFEPAQP